MIHKHHIIPKYMGGSDDPENLIELTPAEHAKAHLLLYETYCNKEDLCAYYMLSGKRWTEEFQTVYASLGGTASQQKRRDQGLSGPELFYGRSVTPLEQKNNCAKGGQIQGKINAENGHMQRIQKLSDPVAAGKKGGATTIARGKGSFADPVERLKSASKGGKTQGKRNAENGHLKRIAQIPSKKNRGLKWITNGTKNKMINPGEDIPLGYHFGKTQKPNKYSNAYK